MGRLDAALLLIVLVACVLRAKADGLDQKYKEGDRVPLYANKVGPFHNPSETYRYYDLPFCKPDHINEKKEALGEVLNGDRLVNTPYELNFRKDKQTKNLCKKTLFEEDAVKTREAISRDYYFQMFYDDLPFWGFIGKVEKNMSDPRENKYFLFKHIHFEILYNDDRVIEINVYGILFIVFVILIVVTAFVTVASPYFQLAAEDHDWWWRSVLCGGSTGLFIFFYCLYYYHVRTDMSGLMQASFFFGYMACICYGFFLMLGTVGFCASLFFVRRIYRSIKCEKNSSHYE